MPVSEGVLIPTGLAHPAPAINSGAAMPPASYAAPAASAPMADPVTAEIERRRTELLQSGADPVEVERQVRQILAGFDPRQPNAVLDFGRHAGDKVAQYSNDMLGQVKSGQMNEVGGKLTEIVVLAKGINLSDLKEQGSKMPLIGGLIDRFKLGKEKVLGRFETLSRQIDTIVAELDVQQQRLNQRTQDLEQVYKLNVQEYYGLSNHIIAGDIKLGEMRNILAEMKLSPAASDPIKAQEINDYQAVLQRLEKRVHDLKVMQTIAVQTAPMIRMVQSNNQALVEKFHNIKALTIPAWKKQFTLAIALMEQQKSVALATKIDDATNDFLKKNAELLHQNSVGTARANQRAIVDIETLEAVQQSLISTFEEVAQIQQDGERKRAEAAGKMEQIKQELVTKLAGKM
ncbi:toxic anion resistance protein [Chitinimonas arctica]|nr:toxic anion resistance protein [Chitinimonas arctica]